MDEARRGPTPIIEEVARAEGVEPERLARLVATGRVTIPRNVRRETRPMGIGELMSTKINANVGTSRDYVNEYEEIEKAHAALRYGADTIMDLSTGGDLDHIRRRILKAIDAPVGSVPIYQAAVSRQTVVDMTSDDMFNAVRQHAHDGIDFVTVHAGVNQAALERLRQSGRLLDVVSRGGSFTIAWMIHHNRENPFYAEYDYLLEIAREYDLTLSLGDGMRPGCIYDASDRAKFMEFITLGELVRRARAVGVQTFVEGPGHVPIDEVRLSVEGMKHLTDHAPLYLLGPLVTDIAPGYDHIVGAIGGALAGTYGADFLCMVTPAEHLALPTVEDIKEGAIITKIAAHTADLVKPGPRERAREQDRLMALARRDLDWEKQFQLAIDHIKPQTIRECRQTHSDACSMCGDLCAIKIIKEHLNNPK